MAADRFADRLPLPRVICGIVRTLELSIQADDSAEQPGAVLLEWALPSLRLLANLQKFDYVTPHADAGRSDLTGMGIALIGDWEVGFCTDGSAPETCERLIILTLARRDPPPPPTGGRATPPPRPPAIVGARRTDRLASWAEYALAAEFDLVAAGRAITRALALDPQRDVGLASAVNALLLDLGGDLGPDPQPAARRGDPWPRAAATATPWTWLAATARSRNGTDRTRGLGIAVFDLEGGGEPVLVRFDRDERRICLDVRLLAYAHTPATIALADIGGVTAGRLARLIAGRQVSPETLQLVAFPLSRAAYVRVRRLDDNY